MNSDPDISIIILCYMAGAPIRDFVDVIRREGLKRNCRFELILVAHYWPGRDDETPQVVRNYAADKEDCKVVAEPKQGGMGWDMRSGLKAASGRVLVVIDGDNQFSPELVYEVYDMLIAENLDLCKTHRVKRMDGLYRHFISVVFNLVFRILFPGCRYKDINSKPKALRREAYKKMNLVSDDWFIDAEIMMQAQRLDLQVGSFPIRFEKNSRQSFVKPWAIFEFLKNLTIHRFREFK